MQGKVQYYNMHMFVLSHAKLEQAFSNLYICVYIHTHIYINYTHVNKHVYIHIYELYIHVYLEINYI